MDASHMDVDGAGRPHHLLKCSGGRDAPYFAARVHNRFLATRRVLQGYGP